MVVVVLMEGLPIQFCPKLNAPREGEERWLAKVMYAASSGRKGSSDEDE